MFSSILQDIIDKVNGIHILAVFDKDGFVVDKIDNEGIADEVSAEFSSILRFLENISSVRTISRVESFLFEGGERKFFLKKLTDGYYILALMDQTALTGKLKYVLNVVNDEFIKEFQ
jgi:predicted regulator of Ras-like GTPase activity (Roadblock/LC7/MglB family)